MSGCAHAKLGVLGPVLLVALSFVAPSQADDPFVRSDVDGNGRLDVVDALGLFSFLFGEQGFTPTCLDAADADDNGEIQITDAVFVLNHIFLRGAPPPTPFPLCGEDPTDDVLDCAANQRCVLSFFGVPHDAEGLAYVVDRSGSSFPTAGAWVAVRLEIIRNIEDLPATSQFSVIFSDRNVLGFPESGGVADATQENQKRARAWMAGVPLGAGSCIKDGLLAGVASVSESTATRKKILYVGDGGGTCSGRNEADYLAETLEEVTAANTDGIVIDTYAVFDLNGRAREVFLRELAERNGGSYHVLPLRR